MSEIKRYKLIKQTPYNGWVEDDGTPMQIGRVIFSDEILSGKPFSFWVEGNKECWEEIKEEQLLKKGDKYKCIQGIEVFEKDEIYLVVMKGGTNYVISKCNSTVANPCNFPNFYDHFEKVESDSKTALRYNDGKPQWSLVHFKSLESFVRVLEYGAHKYSLFEKPDGTHIKGVDCTPEEAKNYKLLSSGRDNWKKGLENKKILDSAMRHLSAMVDGEIYDEESGLLHSSHLMCNLMFYNYNYIENGKMGKD